MDNTNQVPQQEPTDPPTPQPIGPVLEPQQQPIVSQPMPVPAKSKRGLVIIIALGLILGAGGLVSWFAFAKNNKSEQSSSTSQTENTTQSSQITSDSSGCAYIPKQNYQENEGLYGIWRERAKKVNFDVYLPCKIFKDFTIAELGISDENGGKVFLRFNRPEPEEGEDNLQDDTWFYIQAATATPECKTGCTKAGDSKFGPVYKNSQDDLYLTINNALITWSFPPYDDSGDIRPILEIIDSLQKVDPQKLEFFNG